VDVKSALANIRTEDIMVGRRLFDLGYAVCILPADHSSPAIAAVIHSKVGSETLKACEFCYYGFEVITIR
jgi:hypothetical protein